MISYRITNNFVNFYIPYGVRTRVFALKKQCPQPLDERDREKIMYFQWLKNS